MGVLRWGFEGFFVTTEMSVSVARWEMIGFIYLKKVGLLCVSGFSVLGFDSLMGCVSV